MIQKEIKNKIEKLTFNELKNIVDVAFNPIIAEDHLVRQLVKECLNEEVYVHVGIMILLPYIAQRLVEMLETKELHFCNDLDKTPMPYQELKHKE